MWLSKILGLKSWQTYLLKTTVTSSGMFGVPVLGGAAKTNRERDGEMEKERPNSTFDPRGRCHGYRMVWERAQDKPKEQEKKERPKESLSLTLTRSVSSLSPSVLHKKWRKRSSKADMEEWDGGGRTSREVWWRRATMRWGGGVCAVSLGSKGPTGQASRRALLKQRSQHTSQNLSGGVLQHWLRCFWDRAYRNVLNQQKDHLETTRDEKERTAGLWLRRAYRHMINTGHKSRCTEYRNARTSGWTEYRKDKNQDDQNSEAPTNQNEQNTDNQTCKDEQTVEIEIFRAMWRKYITGRRHTDGLQ